MPARLSIRALVALIGLSFAATSLAPAAGADIGSRGPSFLGAGSNVSGSKPQSKLWWNDGRWWASMWDTASADFHIFRHDGAAGWADTGVQLDARNGSRADVLWDGSKLYVASHVFTESPVGGFPTRFYRYSYNAATKTYSRDAGFPVAINDFKTETVTIEKDSTGRIWATWVQGAQVYVNHTLGDDLTWSTPFVLPAADTTVLADDISSVVAFGGDRIGVMWSNQVTGSFHFAVHRDTDPVSAWASGPVPGVTLADDHVNLKADSAGRVYAAVKRNVTPSSGQPMIVLLVREPSGAWTNSTVSLSGVSHTRPIVQLDELNGIVHVLATGPQPPATSGQAGGDIYEKSATLTSLAFPPGVGTPVIRQDGNPDLNDVTSTKQGVNSLTGLPLLATENATDFYWHTLVSLVPTMPPVAEFSADQAAGVAPLTVAFTDRSSGAPAGWAWSFGDGGASTAQNPTHVYAAAGTYDVSLVATNTNGSDTETKAGFITVTAGIPAPTADFSAAPTSGAEPLAVTFTDLSTGSPSSWSWSFGDGATSTQPSPVHLYGVPGTYTVELTVTNPTGSSTKTRAGLVTVTALPAPVASFDGTPTVGTTPLTVGFSDRSSGVISTWSWDFGDGTASTLASPTHVYADAGTYTVQLTVANKNGSSTQTRVGYITTGAPQPNVGKEGLSFAGGGSAVTASKPQSKLWWNDGFWWASMWSGSGNHIFRLDPATDTWVDTGTALDPRTSSRADVLWDGTKLYVISHVFTSNPEPGNPTRLFRYSYDVATDTYSADAGFPVQVNGLKLESAVLDKDSAGTLWATWTFGSQVYVSHSVGGNDATWSTPAVLPFPVANVAPDDISTVVAFDEKVGVLWSDQVTDRFHLALHADGDPDTSWTLETLPVTQADDHINVKVDSGGRLWTALKRQLPLAAGEPEIVLATRENDGSWSWVDVGVASESHTRPIVLLDETQRTAHVLMTGPQPPSPSGQTGGTIYEKVASMDDLVFQPGLGSVVIRDGRVPDMNDVTSTKQNLSEASGLVALAGNDTTDLYWHASIPLIAPVRAAFAGSPTAGLGPLTVTFSDLSSGHPTSWTWDFGDGTSSAEQTPTHTYGAPGSYTVRLTAAKPTSSDTTTIEGYIVVKPPPPVAGFAAEPTEGASPLAVSFTDTTAGAPTSWSWDFGDGGTSIDQSPTHTYLAEGLYTVTLTAANAGGSSAAVSSVRVYVPPVADLTGDPLEGIAPLTVRFTDASSASPTSWLWSFGDSLTSALQHPLHTYVSPGRYTVSLAATNPAGSTTVTRPDYVRVLEPPPAAAFSATPVTGPAPLNVQFSNQSANATTFLWNFGDGTTSTEQAPAHLYSARGRYTVTLTASNSNGTSTVTKENLIAVSQRIVTTATADATVRGKHREGTKPELRVDGKDNERSYLRFAVTGIPAGATIESVRLMLFVQDPSVDGGSVFATSGAWTEATIVEANAPPAVGAALGAVGATTLGTWSATGITGVQANGTYDFILQGPSRDSGRYSSREGLNPPQLVITVVP